MSEIEGAGDLVTGAGLARAIEPSAGEHGGVTPSCLNCGALLSGAYCHACGQKAEVHRSLGAFWHDFTHSIIHFEGKIWRTLPLLFFKPGELTRQYVHGERARFVSPLALFLFSVFAMFAVFAIVGGPFSAPADVAALRQDMERDAYQLRRQIDLLDQRRAELAAGQASAALDAELAEARQELRALEATRSIVLVPNSGPEGTSRMVNMSEMRLDTGLPWLDRSFVKARDNPSLLLYKVQSNAYKFSWALVLLSLPFVWLVFAWKRQFHLFDHLVFVTYSLCFATLLLVTLALLSAIGLDVLIGPLIGIGVPLHLYAQLRGGYALSRRSALWRTAFLLLAAGIVLLVFALLLLAIGAL